MSYIRAQCELGPRNPGSEGHRRAIDYFSKELEGFGAQVRHQVFEFRDDGPGFPVDVLDFEHWNVGMYLVQNIVCRDLRGEMTLFNDNGAVITIRFPASVEA